MKRLFVILFLIPSLAFGAFTELYCQSGGSNLNSGIDTNNTASYTTAGGNWANATRIFTVTDSTNPSLSIAVGDICAVYVTSGATVATFLAKATAVQNATNGTVTFGGTFAGANPSNGTGTMTLKRGGAWKGPNAAVGFPFNVANMASITNAGDAPRINMKNDASYLITSGIAGSSASMTNVTIQGYSSTVNDGGKFTVDAQGNNINVWTGTAGYSLVDAIIVNSASTGTATGINDGGIAGVSYTRVVVHGMRGSGFKSGPNSILYECEAYGNNTGNGSTAGNRAGFTASGAGATRYKRCISHDNTGSNTFGFEDNSGNSAQYDNCIADTNGNDGFNYLLNGSTGMVNYFNCDSYNNGGDGIGIDFSSGTLQGAIIENTNLIKNTGKGINNTLTTAQMTIGFAYNNGYGAGTQANGSADVLANIISSGAVTYASDVTPWVDPANGDFRINLATAQGAGRGAFTETATSYTGSIGYPDIGAVQANIGTAFPTPTATPSVTPTSTPTPTATATVTPTVTPTPTAPIEQSYVYPN